MTSFLVMLAALGQTTGDPVAVITGPDTGRPGQIVILDASESENATGFTWHIETDAMVPEDVSANAAQWADYFRNEGWTEPAGDEEPLWLISGDGKRVLLASYPGTYRATLAVGNVQTDTPSIAHHTFRSVAPDAPPDNPDHPDVPPPPEFDLEDEAAIWASEVTQHRDRLPGLGNAFIQVGNAHAVLGSKQAIDGLLEITLKGGFPNELPAWAGLAVQVDTALAGIREQATVAQYGAAVESIGRGLKR